MTSLAGVATVAALLANGLLAGLFFAFTIAVVPALRRAGDRTYVTVMREVNIVILRPGFLAVFILAPGLSILVAVLELPDHGSRWALVVAAGAAAVSAVLTATINVPLNQTLHHAQIGSGTDADTNATAARAAFDRPWARANALRCAANAVAVVALGVALVGPCAGS